MVTHFKIEIQRKKEDNRKALIGKSSYMTKSSSENTLGSLFQVSPIAEHSDTRKLESSQGH